MLTPSSQEVEGGGFEQVKFVRDIQEKVISGMRWPEKAEALAAADEGENEEEEGRGGGGKEDDEDYDEEEDDEDGDLE